MSDPQTEIRNSSLRGSESAKIVFSRLWSVFDRQYSRKVTTSLPFKNYLLVLFSSIPVRVKEC